MIGQGVETLELVIDGPRQDERIEAITKRRKGGDLGAIGVWAGLHPFQRGAGSVVSAADPSADALLPQELHGRQKQVLQETEFLTVEIVDRREGGGGVVADVTEELADVGPVLLLDMGVVVFLVRPPAGELDGLGLAVVIQGGVDELGAVVGVDAAQAKGQRLAQGFEGAANPAAPLPRTAAV